MSSVTATASLYSPSWSDGPPPALSVTETHLDQPVTPQQGPILALLQRSGAFAGRFVEVYFQSGTATEKAFIDSLRPYACPCSITSALLRQPGTTYRRLTSCLAALGATDEKQQLLQLAVAQAGRKAALPQPQRDTTTLQAHQKTVINMLMAQPSFDFGALLRQLQSSAAPGELEHLGGLSDYACPRAIVFSWLRRPEASFTRLEDGLRAVGADGALAMLRRLLAADRPA